MLFRSDGSLIAIKSRPRNRDSYHLAALIAHYILLDHARVMLVGIGGPLQGKRIPMDKQVLRVGSASNNDVVIKGDAYVSRLHAALSYEEDALFITDQRSTNGTFINGNLLRDSAVRLNSGDKIRVGHSIFEVAYAESKDRPKVAVAYESDRIACTNS
jgi:predicted component of type VI protein secretion system